MTSLKCYFQGLLSVIPGDILGRWWVNHTFCPLHLNPRLMGFSPATNTPEKGGHGLIITLT